MAMQRLKVDPVAIDLMLTAIVLTRRDRIQHAGHYAFLALGRVLSRNLDDEEGETTPTNFSRRMDRLVDEKGLKKEWRDKLISLWNKIRYYLYTKVSYIPTHRANRIKRFVGGVKYILEQAAGVKFEDVLCAMTFEDIERLHGQSGDDLAPDADFSLPA